MVLINDPHFELHQNNGPLVERVSIAMIVVSFIAMALRFLSRRLVRQPLLWDDWFIPMAVACSWAVAIIEIVAVKHGKFGQHIKLGTATSIPSFFKALYAVQIMYPTGIACIKFSILLFYRRLFKIPQAKLPLMIMGGIVLAWLITMVLMAIFSCKPVNSFWIRDPEKPSVCTDTVKYFLGVAVPNIATDIMLLVFPLPMIWNLQVNMSNRIALTSIFVIGGFIVIISTLRLVTVIQANGNLDVTWALVPLGIFNVIEMNVGILCACLPSMTPLLRVMLGKGPNKTSNIPSDPQSKTSFSRRNWLGKQPHVSLDSHNESVTWLEDASSAGAGAGTRTKTVINGGSPEDIELQEGRRPIGQIQVDRDITWS